MKGKKLLAGALSAAMVFSTMSFNAFAADNVAKIGDVEYTSFAEALTAANSMTGDVVIDLTANANLKSDIEVTNKTTVNLGGNTLTLNATANASNPGIGVAGNIEFVGDDDQTSKIDIESNSACGGDALICLGWGGMSRADVKMSGLTFNAPTTYDNACGLFGVYGGSNIEFDNVTINANSNTCTDEYRCKTVFYGEGLDANTSVKINDTKVNATKNECVFYGFNSADIDGLVYEGQIAEYVFSVVNGTVKNSTFTYTDTTETKSIMRDAGYETALTFEETNFNDVPNCTSGVFKITNSKSVISADENTAVNSETNQNAFVAKIDDIYYATFESALAAAQADDTITLVADAEINNVPNAKITNAETINLNGKTLTLNDGGIQLAGINFVGGEGETRGKIVAANNTGYQGILYLCWGGTMTFKNIDIDATALKQAYVIEAQTWSENNIVLDNTTIDAKADTTRGLSTVIAAWGGAFTMKNSSKIEVSNTTGHAINGGANVTITDSTVTATNTKDGIYHSGGSLKIDGNSNVTVVNPTGDETWNPTGAGIVLGDQTPYTKADTATVNATVYKKVVENNVADKVNVKFVPTTEANVYDIVVVPTDNTKVINRLSAAEFDFKLTTDDDMSFVVAGAENVNVTRDNNDHILFNFDGVTEADASGVEVKLGTVTINGYGSFAFGIKADGNNKVQTAKVNNNIVYTVEIESLTFNGIEGNIEVPTKELTINIDFPNAVNDNAKEYQDMKVTVVGGTENRTFNLGTGTNGVAMENGKYVITTNLPENTSYTVEVSGAGYRTARYTVTMNADKTLNFWNNVKDNATEVEENAAIKKNVTFLAGELVNDGKINIYDLSAVVSYFGTQNNVNAESQYAKYDLNRDGKIDSKDIAYVLVSWGK